MVAFRQPSAEVVDTTHCLQSEISPRSARRAEIEIAGELANP
jgi:hypothetical protein